MVYLVSVLMSPESASPMSVDAGHQDIDLDVRTFDHSVNSPWQAVLKESMIIVIHLSYKEI